MGGISPAWADSATIDCRYRSAVEMAEKLRPLLGEGASVGVDAASNRVIVRGNAAVVRDARRIVRELDVDPQPITGYIQRVDPDWLTDVGVPIQWTHVDQQGRMGVMPAPDAEGELPAGRGGPVRWHSSADAARLSFVTSAGNETSFSFWSPVSVARLDRVYGTELGGLARMKVAEAQLMFNVSPTVRDNVIFVELTPYLLVWGDTVEAKRVELTSMKRSARVPLGGALVWEVGLGSHAALTGPPSANAASDGRLVLMIAFPAHESDAERRDR
ncbi:MAG: hypothetical protein H6684_05865 [Deltaproteobacteria bacterium]|nr:hypothetical protein [Deltaproteobacteria bacterium]MCB9478722.1 hypothetical protein [Deltaproteobacteria bacterium]MCB9488238.1 hypothetical protein [Deltaproteobacteria bacterium]